LGGAEGDIGVRIGELVLRVETLGFSVFLTLNPETISGRVQSQHKFH
jgi:hypothetical protein